jgi:16S rRNA (guanine527-N7)-methyltransferase
VKLSEAQEALVARYIAAVLDYNKKANLTADDEPRLLRDRHIADGLAAIPVLKGLGLGENPSIADLGSGGGFIGIAIKIGWPEARVTLIEPLEKRFRFLSGIAAELGLEGLRVVRKNAAESKAAGLKFDAVVARALAELPEATRLAMPLVGGRGYFVAYQSEKPAKSPWEGVTLVDSVSYQLPSDSRQRFFLIFQKK